LPDGLDPASLIPLGFLDGLNICSLTILAVLISLLFTAGTTRRMILLTGSLFILGVFISYLGVGFGLLSLAVALPTVPHFLARIGGGIMIFVGSTNVINAFRPGTFSLNLAPAFSSRVLGYARSASLPTASVAGVLAGFHNFPCACTGGIYLTFISLVAESASRLTYLVLYNLAMVTPLLAILSISVSKTVVLSVRRWQQENRGKLLLGLGVTMIGVGFLVLALAAVGVAH